MCHSRCLLPTSFSVAECSLLLLQPDRRRPSCLPEPKPARKELRRCQGRPGTDTNGCPSSTIPRSDTVAIGPQKMLVRKDWFFSPFPRALLNSWLLVSLRKSTPTSSHHRMVHCPKPHINRNTIPFIRTPSSTVFALQTPCS